MNIIYNLVINVLNNDWNINAYDVSANLLNTAMLHIKCGKMLNVISNTHIIIEEYNNIWNIGKIFFFFESFDNCLIWIKDDKKMIKLKTSNAHNVVVVATPNTDEETCPLQSIFVYKLKHTNVTWSTSRAIDEEKVRKKITTDIVH